jgi:hypothetical protein
MWQTAAVCVIVAAAAAWITWRLLLPTTWQARLRTLAGRAPARPPDGCGCARDPL